MATTNFTTSTGVTLSSVPMIADPAARAAFAMEHAATDRSYEVARVNFMESRATSLEGVAAKLEFVQTSLRDGADGMEEWSAAAFEEIHGLVADALRYVNRARSN